MRIILASNSPRRKDLLATLIKDFEIVSSTAEDDSDIKARIKEPVELVEKLSIVKAKDVFSKEQSKSENLIVIGGDTIVYLDGEVLGKPKNEEDAFDMLSRLQGRENEVYTGLALAIKIGNQIREEVYSNKTIVKMNKMSEEDIWEYIATKDPMDKAGSYAVQGIGSKYIENVKGNYNAVVGLDTDKLESVLKKYGGIQ